MNRHSILFKLNILFAIALIATIIAAISILSHTIKKDDMALIFKSRLISKEMAISRKVPAELLEEFGLRELKGDEKQEVLIHATLKQTPPHHMQRGGRRRAILTYQGHKYLHIKFRGNRTMLLEDEQNFIGRFFTPLVIFVGIVALLILIYTLLRRSLIPLRKLEDDIIRYGDGELKEFTYSVKKDEISSASNAFYRSIEKVKRLTKSRQLFIRNLFHELNTPVTKGKILTELVEDPQTHKMLDSIFTRLSMLLKELANVEKITSQNYSIVPKPVRIIELVDEASDLLFLDEKITTNITDEMIEADFSSMSIVFKNLIDNALKYGDNLEIVYDKEQISFVSQGEALKEDFANYTEPFSKGRESSNEKGFGLGLYIVSEIIKEHKMNFGYRYENKNNIFTVAF